MSGTYRGDPAAVAAAKVKLRRGKPLRMLAISTTVSAAWPAVLLGAFNSSHPGAHELVHIQLQSLKMSGCLNDKILRDYGSQADLVVLELGYREAEAVTSSDRIFPRLFNLAEGVLRPVVAAMASPSAMLLLPCGDSCCSDTEAAQRGVDREGAILRSPSSALMLLAQFYGLPAAGGSCLGAALYSHHERGLGGDAHDKQLATAALTILQQHKGTADDGDGVGWHLPSRRMLLDGSPELAAQSPCAAPLLGRGARGRGASVIPLARCSRTTVGRAPIQCSGWDAVMVTRVLDAYASDEELPASRMVKKVALSPAVQRIVEARAAMGMATAGVTSQSTRGSVRRQAVLKEPPKRAVLRNATYGVCQRGSGLHDSTCFQGGALTLSRREIERTRANDGVASLWGPLFARLDAGLNVSIAILGGSMSLSLHQPAWPDELAGWMRRTWPAATITMHNGAIGATGSTFFALCCETRLPETVDFVVLEHALNDGEHIPVVDDASLRSRALVYEVLVRRLLSRSRRPALLFLSWDRLGWCANMEATPRYEQRIIDGPQRGVPWLMTPQIAVDLVARWYGIPSIAPRNAIWHRDCSDLQFRGSFCDAGGVNGCGHLRALGVRLVVQTVSSFLGNAAERVRRGARRGPHPHHLWDWWQSRDAQPQPRRSKGSDLASAGRSTVGIESLPPYVVPAALFGAASHLKAGVTGQCARGADLQQLKHRVVSGDWKFVRRDPQQPPLAPDKPGFLSLVASSVIEVDVGPTPMGAVSLGFLRSYDDKMGSIQVTCGHGCACNQTSFSGWHNKKSSVLTMGLLHVRGALSVAAATACTLRLEHVQPLGPKQWGSKVKLLAIITPPFALDLSDREFSQAASKIN